MDKVSESPATVYGRLVESVHVSGYTMERACVGLEYLLEENRWKSVGKGFDDIDAFLSSIDLSQFKIAVDRRKKLAKRLAELQAPQRATAKALGVGVATVNRDIVPSGTKAQKKTAENDVDSEPIVPSGTPTPLSASGADVGRMVEQKARRQANKERQKDNTTAPVPEGVFDVVYADPPWRYDNSGFPMAAEAQYPTMDTKSIAAYRDKDGKEIYEAIADNAVLFLWVTNPLLRDGLEVMDSWGFDYKTNLVWIKKNHTAGFYVFGQHELLLIGTRGTGMLPVWKPKSIIQGDNVTHSQKPTDVYETIERMYPGHQYLELFARVRRDGWESVGNECQDHKG